MPKPKTEKKTIKKIKLLKAVTDDAFRKIMLEKHLKNKMNAEGKKEN